MSVSATVSKTLGGSNVSDVLFGTSTGYDFGTATNSTSTTPVHDLYFRHNGVNSITSCAYYISIYTGIYGGDYSAAVDYAKIIDHGDSSAGLQLEETYSATPFLSSYYTVNSTQGANYSTKRIIQTPSILYNNSSVESDPSVRVAGTIGTSGNSTLGDNAKFRIRYLIPMTESQGGRRQFDFVFTFNFTT